MSHYDRDAEIAAFILTKGVTRYPTACVVPTQGSPDPTDQAALERYEIARDELRRMKIATRQRSFTLGGLAIGSRIVGTRVISRFHAK